MDDRPYNVEYTDSESMSAEANRLPIAVRTDEDDALMAAVAHKYHGVYAWAEKGYMLVIPNPDKVTVERALRDVAGKIGNSVFVVALDDLVGKEK